MRVTRRRRNVARIDLASVVVLVLRQLNRSTSSRSVPAEWLAAHIHRRAAGKRAWCA